MAKAIGNETAERAISKDVFNILQRLYGVKVALSITTAIGLTISSNGIALNPLDLSSPNIALFGAFFITVVPFYHGGSMHLLRNYIHANPIKKRGVALFDFLALSFEGVVFFAIAASIKNLTSFETWFLILLVLDTLWLGFTYLASDKNDPAPKLWAIINGAMIVFFIVILGIGDNILPQIYSLIFVAAVIRTVIDYAYCYDYYFPDSKRGKCRQTRL
jgi:hypothetical protein